MVLVLVLVVCGAGAGAGGAGVWWWWWWFKNLVSPHCRTWEESFKIAAKLWGV